MLNAGRCNFGIFGEWCRSFAARIFRRNESFLGMGGQRQAGAGTKEQASQ